MTSQYKNNDGRVLASDRNIECIKNIYRELLLENKFGEARELEKRNGYPQTWLNYVISGLIIENISNNNGLAARLVSAFRDRGFGDSWLGKL